jgi:hypothetical protein
MKKDGHVDVASSRRMCQTIIEDATDILQALPEDSESELPTWWTNKLAICSAYVNSARDYLVHNNSNTDNSDDKDDDMDEDTVEDTMEETTNNEQVTIGDYTTRHFDICPSAVELYSNIEDKTDMVHLVVESMMLQDMLFKIEKQAIAMDNADQDMVDKAQHYADMINNIAEQMGLEQEHSYIEDVHMAKIKELAFVEDITDEEDMLPPSVRLMKEQKVANS